jgi:UDP-N-acetylmuramoyl-tripeptide--D-alanyl-D-alanine ligase
MWPRPAEWVRFASGSSVRASEALEGLVVRGATTDSRKIGPGCLFVAVRGERFDGHDFVEQALREGASVALVDASWAGVRALPNSLSARCLVAKADTTSAFRSLARALRAEFPFPVVGVGGSNGKTTTKEMLSALLSGAPASGAQKGPARRTVTRTEKSENGFLGVAISLTQKEHSLEGLHAPCALVLEIGIDDVGAMREHVALSAPDVVLLTALGPEHLAGLGTWETAVKEECDLFFTGSPKIRIWQLEDEKLVERLSQATVADVFVASEDTFKTPHIAAFLSQAEKRGHSGAPRALSRLSFRVISEGAQKTELFVKWAPGNVAASEPVAGVGRPAPAFEATFTVGLPGLHNARNFALAVATAACLGQGADALEVGWRMFVPPAMRSRLVALQGDRLLYDDSYNASPASMDAALDALENPEWAHRTRALVLGDMLDLGGESKKWHDKLTSRLALLRGVHLCLFGEAMYDVYSCLMEKDLSQKNFATLKWLPADADPGVWVQDVLMPLAPSLVLVKGSRGMGLDRVAKAMESFKPPP